MNYSICLDQFSTNFNIANLSSNGFSIYTNLDNFTNPIAQNIPYQDLFAPPIGNCPYVVNLPQGATQLVVIDACTSMPNNVASIFATGSNSVNNLTTTCCYAVIDVPAQPVSWCDTSGLTFDVFSSSYIGQIVAGNLISNIGTVTDYTIGWYLNGDYSSPEFVSGYGNTFQPYSFLHPLTGNSSVPVLAGSWEGIIHDIAINGTTYSSVSGSANGTPIPFESCFDTVVVSPLTCDNGTVSPSISKYSHQFNFNSQAIGTSPNPVSLTYALEPTTKYFAYIFQGLNVWDELEIKFKSGNPSATTNPSLYSQPIYLEKIKIGADAPNTPDNYNNISTTPLLPQNAIGWTGTLNNVWPKSIPGNGWMQRTLTLTTLETSSNPSTPDLLEITITPNPTNNNTQWKAGFQCLDTFDCTDCTWDNYPANLPKPWKLRLQKVHGCDQQRLNIYMTSSCNPESNTSDWMGYSFTTNPLASPNINLVGSFMSSFPSFITAPHVGWINLSPNVSCVNTNYNNNPSCGPSSTGSITLNKTPQQIQLTFNLESDYLYYQSILTSAFINMSSNQQGTPLTGPIACTGTTNIDYYRYYRLKIPTQGANANCGDNTTQVDYYFHFNDYFNIVYNPQPSTNTWTITIPQTPMVNCYPSGLGCDSCSGSIDQFVYIYNSNVNSLTNYTFTTNVGAKYNVIGRNVMNKFSTPTLSGSYCYSSTSGRNQYPWYGIHTVPFISSSTGWVNLTSLQTAIPCITSSFPNPNNASPTYASYYGSTYGYQVRFPNLTSSFNYSTSTNDFEIYSYVGSGSAGTFNNIPNSPCPNSPTKIYSYIGGVATMYTSSYFWNSTTPILVIDP